MRIKTLAEHGTSCAQIGRLLSLPESNVRHRLGRIRSGSVDGRSSRPRRADAVSGAIAHWMSQHQGTLLNLAALHDWLMCEHDYPGLLRSVQRYVSDHYGAPPPGSTLQRRFRRFREHWVPTNQRLSVVIGEMCVV